MIGASEEKRNLDVLPLTGVYAFLKNIFGFAEVTEIIIRKSPEMLLALARTFNIRSRGRSFGHACGADLIQYTLHNGRFPG